MIELINELINDASPVYFYLSILLTVASACSFSTIQFGDMLDTHHFQIRESHNERYRLLPIQELFGMCDEIFQWVVKKANRITAPDDDTDHSSFSLRAMDLIQRGGNICAIILYSLFLRNTVSLV